MIKYYWEWNAQEFFDKTRELDVLAMSREDWMEYNALYKEHFGSTADFCEFFKSAVEAAKKHFPAPIAKGLALQIPALEAGDIHRLELAGELGQMTFFVYDLEKEDNNEQS